MQKEKIISRKLLALFLLAFMLVELLLGVLPLTARAEDSVGNALGSQTVEQDLEAAGFDLSLYNKNLAADPEVMMLSELGYTEEGRGLDESFYLLVYVYNPSGIALDLAENNTVNLGIGGENYENCKLVCYGSSSDHLFYRFYVTRDKSFLTSARECAAANGGTRTYSVAGIQLWNSAAEALRDNKVGKAYSFTGYAKGCDKTSELVSTLRSSYTGLETLSLELEHTTWRNKVYDPSEGQFSDEGICDAISTVYFGVPEKYIYDYKGGLQQISAEWYEYKTTPIFVTWDKDRADELRPWLGKTMGAPNVLYGVPSGPVSSNEKHYYEGDHTDFSFSKFNALTCRVLWKNESTSRGSYIDFKFGASFNPRAQYWNSDHPTALDPIKPWETRNLEFYQHESTAGLTGSFSIVEEGILPKMSWLFEVGTPKSFKDAMVSSERLEEYMRDYTKPGTLQIHGYSVDLFEASIDADRIELLTDSFNEENRGHIRQTVVADEKHNTLVDAELSWWQKFLGKDSYEDLDFSVLYVLTLSDILFVESLDSSNESDVRNFEERFLVENENTSAKSGSVLKELQKMIDNDLVPVLYRFAVTDYAVYNAWFDDTDEHYTDKGLVNAPVSLRGGVKDKVNGYVAQQTVFLDFDVISLGFDTGEQGQALRIIPVVADPIDVISGLIAPNDVPIEETEWWQKIIMLLGLILILVVFGTYLMPVFMFLWSNLMNVLYNLAKLLWKVLLWLVGLPFRLLGRIFRR